MTLKNAALITFLTSLGVCSATGAEFYSTGSETTNGVFSVDVSSQTLTELTWKKPTDGTAVVSNEVIALDADVGDELTYTPTQTMPASSVTQIKAKCKSDSFSLAPDPTDDGLADAQAVLSIVTNETAGLQWIGLYRDGSTNAWAVLTGVKPLPGVTYDILIELDHRASDDAARKVRYSVKSGDAYVVLKQGDTAWFTNCASTNTAVRSVAFAGTGDIGDFGADQVLENVCESADGHGYTSFDAALAADKGANEATTIKLLTDWNYTPTTSRTIWVDANEKTFTINGAVCTQSGNSYTMTVHGDCYAKIGETWYATLSNAIAAVKTGETITMQKAYSGEIAFSDADAAKAVTLEANGKTVSTAALSVGANVALTVDALTFAEGAKFAYGGTMLTATTLTLPASDTVTIAGTLTEGTSVISSGSLTEASASKFTPSALEEGLAFCVRSGVLKVAKIGVNVTTSTSNDNCWNYTNKTVTVALDDVVGAVSTTLTVKDASGNPVYTQTRSGITTSGNVKFDVGQVGGLTPGSSYYYEVTTTPATGTATTTRGTFVTANTSNNWIVATSTKTEGGSWLETPTWENDETVISTSNTFNVSATQKGSLVNVETSIRYTSALDVEDLADLSSPSEVQGAIVVVTNSTEGGAMTWYGVGGTEWKALSGPVPALNKDYVIRAEFDYAQAKISYLVAEKGGAFTRLTDGTTAWLDLTVAGATPSTLDRVDIVGSGVLSGLVGECANANLAKIGETEYATFDAALKAANGRTVDLLTNVRWVPSGAGVCRIGSGTFQFVLDGATGSRVKCADGLLRVNDYDEAKIGEKAYGFVEDALTNANAGETITLLTNVTYYAAMTAPAKEISLDAAGFDFLNGYEGVTLTILKGGTLVFTNSTAASGYMNATFDGEGTYKLAGGKWAGTLATDKLYSDKYRAYALEPTYTHLRMLIDTQVVYVASADAPSAEVAKAVPMAVVDSETGATNIVADVVVSNGYITAHCTDKTKSTAVQLNEKRTRGEGCNGATLLESYVLGLDPDQKNSLPIVEKASETSTGITISLGNVNVNQTAGVPVKFALETSTSPDFSGATVGDKGTSTSFSVELPADTSGNKVQYHRVRIYMGE